MTPQVPIEWAKSSCYVGYPKPWYATVKSCLFVTTSRHCWMGTKRQETQEEEEEEEERGEAMVLWLIMVEQVCDEQYSLC